MSNNLEGTRPEIRERDFTKPRKVCYLQTKAGIQEISLKNTGSLSVRRLETGEERVASVPLQAFADAQNAYPIEIIATFDLNMEPSLLRDHPLGIVAFHATALETGVEDELRIELEQLAQVFTDTAGNVSVYGDGVQEEQIVALHMPSSSSTNEATGTEVYSLFFPYKDLGNGLRFSSTDGFQSTCEFLANEAKKIIESSGNKRLHDIMQSILGDESTSPLPEVESLQGPRRALFENIVMMTLYRANIARSEHEAIQIVRSLVDTHQTVSNETRNATPLSAFFRRFTPTGDIQAQTTERYSLQKPPDEIVADVLTVKNLGFSTETQIVKSKKDERYQIPSGLELPDDEIEYTDLDKVRIFMLKNLQNGLKEPITEMSRPAYENYTAMLVSIFLETYDQDYVDPHSLTRLMIAIEELEQSVFATSSTIEYRNQRENEQKLLLKAQEFVTNPMKIIKNTRYEGARDSSLRVFLSHVRLKLNERKATTYY